ncbi:MAG: phosphatidate cytidylyltransferase [Planctomycetes bacterium]|nr:phosphatidate cytidylyltransferase [Planctomycetota bacterium]
MKQRLIYGTILIATLLALIYVDERLVSRPYNGILVTGVVLILAILASREMALLVRSAGHEPLAAWAVVSSAALVLIPFLDANADPDQPLLNDWHATVAALVIAFLGSAAGAATRKKTDGAIAAIGTTLLAIIYVGLLASFLVRIRVFGPPGASWLLLYYIGVVKFCDMGAYFTGRAIGKTKLIEWLSPKKTIEGLVGGVTASVVVAVAIPMIVKAVADEGSLYPAMFPSTGKAALFGIAMALVGHAGDLLESLFKRDAKAKDSAAAVPAFGGVLDIIDSPLLTAPLAYWMLL